MTYTTYTLASVDWIELFLHARRTLTRTGVALGISDSPWFMKGCGVKICACHVAARSCSDRVEPCVAGTPMTEVAFVAVSIRFALFNVHHDLS